MNDHQLGFRAEETFIASQCVRFAVVWDSWRKGRLLPTRADVDLTSIKDLMPQMAVVDVESDSVAMIRLIGTDFHPHFGKEMTGVNFIELAPPVDRPLRGYRQMSMSRHPCASVSRIRQEGEEGKITITEIAAFPVAATSGDKPPQIYACTHMLQQDFIPAESENQGDLKVPIAAEFRFLDIGAGVPPENPADQI